jgi:hypothetical protein
VIRRHPSPLPTRKINRSSRVSWVTQMMSNVTWRGCWWLMVAAGPRGLTSWWPGTWGKTDEHESSSYEGRRSARGHSSFRHQSDRNQMKDDEARLVIILKRRHFFTNQKKWQSNSVSCIDSLYIDIWILKK